MNQLLTLLSAGLGLFLVASAVRQPRMGIWLLLLLTPLEVLAWDIGSNLRLYQPLAILCLLIWMAAVVVSKWSLVLTPIPRAMLIWTVSSIPSIINSPAIGDWLQILFIQVFMLALVIMVTNLAHNWERARKLMKAYLLISVIIAMFAVVQAFAIRLFDVNLGLAERQSAYLEIYSRPSGTFEEPNWLAAYLVVPALFLFSFLLSRKVPLAYRRSILTAALFVTLVAMFMTQTRSSFIGLASGLAVILVFNTSRLSDLIKRSIQMVFVVGLIAIIVAIIIPEFVTNLDSSSNPVGIIMRTNSWSYAWDLAWQHPVIGNGLGSWAYHFSLLEDTAGKVIGGRIVPNAFLGVFFETGFLGLASFAYLIFVIVRDVVTTIRRLPAGAIFEQICLKAFLASFAGLMVNFAFTNAIRYGFFWLFVALGASMLRSIRLDRIVPVATPILHADNPAGHHTLATSLQ